MFVGTVHIRIDSIEQAIRESGIAFVSLDVQAIEPAMQLPRTIFALAAS